MPNLQTMLREHDEGILPTLAIVWKVNISNMKSEEIIRTLHDVCPDLKFIIHTGSADYSIPDDLRAMGIDERLLFAKPLLDMTPLAETITALADEGAGT